MKTPAEIGPLGHDALLRGYAPYTLAGYAGFRAVIDSDGAVPARLKALFAAVAAIDRRYPDLAHRELSRGVTLGLTVREATAGMIVLTSLRGEAAALEFGTVIGACFDTLDAPAPQPLPSAAPGEAEANFRSYFGTIPAPLAQLMRLVPSRQPRCACCREVRFTYGRNCIAKGCSHLMTPTGCFTTTALWPNFPKKKASRAATTGGIVNLSAGT